MFLSSRTRLFRLLHPPFPSRVHGLRPSADLTNLRLLTLITILATGFLHPTLLTLTIAQYISLTIHPLVADRVPYLLALGESFLTCLSWTVPRIISHRFCITIIATHPLLLFRSQGSPPHPHVLTPVPRLLRYPTPSIYALLGCFYHS